MEALVEVPAAETAEVAVANNQNLMTWLIDTPAPASFVNPAFLSSQPDYPAYFQQKEGTLRPSFIYSSSIFATILEAILWYSFPIG
ncbi:hypothetical protein GCM10027286_37360 [Virgibacillus ainsalahensis]